MSKWSGYTPTGEILKKHLDGQIALLNEKVGSPDYGKIQPLDIVVVTDGRPGTLSSLSLLATPRNSRQLTNCDVDDKPEDNIAEAAQEIEAKKHHPNCIGIQFVQIGNDEQAKEALQALSYGSAKVVSVSHPSEFQISNLWNVC